MIDRMNGIVAHFSSHPPTGSPRPPDKPPRGPRACVPCPAGTYADKGKTTREILVSARCTCIPVL